MSFVNSWIIEKVVDHYKGRIAGDIRDGVSVSVFVLSEHQMILMSKFFQW